MKKSADVFSMSFLDVLTCGLGAVLLLFFILMTLRKEFVVSAARTARGGTVSGAVDASPFLILATTPSETGIWDSEANAWDILGEPQAELRTESGASYAVVYGEEAPSLETRIVLSALKPDTLLHVQVFTRGKWLYSAEGTAEKLGATNGKLLLWPDSGRTEP